MGKLKILSIMAIIASGANAQGQLQSDAEKVYEEEMSLAMCRSLDHRFDIGSNQCVYCAKGLSYDPKALQCKGTSNLIGKCSGSDHYHAKTQECMYCGKGYNFNEELKECIGDEGSEKEE